MHIPESKKKFAVSAGAAMGVFLRIGVPVLLLGVGAGCASLPWTAKPGPLRYAGYKPEVGESAPVTIGDRFSINPATAGEDPEAVEESRPPTRLKPGDPLTIHLRGPENTSIQDIIDDDGNMVLPNLGHVKLSGLSTSEAEAKIKNAYIDNGIYLRMDVSVIPENQPRQEDAFFVYGEARGPGRYAMGEKMTLLQAISTAGGLTEFANPSRVYLKRGDEITRYDIQSIIRGKEPDVPLSPGDIITIRSKWF